jgi:REP-associated tyrosine transposase
MLNWKTVRHYHEAGDLHELTFSCYRRLPLLTNDTWRARLARYIDAAANEASMDLVAFVFMPEHVHLLVYPTTSNPSISRFLARVKQPFSKQIKVVLTGEGSRLLTKLTVLEQPGKSCLRFWQEGPGFDRNLFSADAISSSLDYIHDNPVPRGICQRAVDWKWSLARYYLDDPARQQRHELPVIHGLPTGSV